MKITLQYNYLNEMVTFTIKNNQGHSETSVLTHTEATDFLTQFLTGDYHIEAVTGEGTILIVDDSVTSSHG